MTSPKVGKYGSQAERVNVWGLLFSPLLRFKFQWYTWNHPFLHFNDLDLAGLNNYHKCHETVKQFKKNIYLHSLHVAKLNNIKDANAWYRLVWNFSSSSMCKERNEIHWFIAWKDNSYVKRRLNSGNNFKKTPDLNIFSVMHIWK